MDLSAKLGQLDRQRAAMLKEHLQSAFDERDSIEVCSIAGLLFQLGEVVEATTPTEEAFQALDKTDYADWNSRTLGFAGSEEAGIDLLLAWDELCAAGDWVERASLSYPTSLGEAVRAAVRDIAANPEGWFCLSGTAVSRLEELDEVTPTPSAVPIWVAASAAAIYGDPA
jgi:hypothetical protein